MRWLCLAAVAFAACRMGDLVQSPPGGARLQFSVQPSSADVGETITPPVQVVVLDDAGQPDTTYRDSVVITLGQNPSGAKLSGDTVAAVDRGRATFASLRLDHPGKGYVLRASAPARPGAMSAAFEVTAEAAAPTPTRLAFTVQPVATQAGASITPAVQVAARDSAGNTITSYTGTITIAIGTNPVGGTLSGTRSATPSNGVATFADLRIDRAGNGYALSATASGLTGATSATFNVTAPPPPPPPPPPPTATRLAFTIQPSTTEAGSAITPAVQVAARDDAGTTVPSFTGTISLAIGTNPAGGALSGTTSATAVNGVATFTNLSIDRAGTGYTLTAGAAGLAGATSAAFNVTSPPPPPPPQATGLRFSVQPSNTGVNQAISPPVQVLVFDAQGNQIPSFMGAVTIDLAPNLLNAAVYGTVTVNAVNGVATFSNLRVNLVGVDFRLRAAFAGQTPIVTSDPFVVGL